MLRTFADHAVLARAAAYHILGVLDEALKHQKRCSLVLSGGTTPEPTYRELVREDELGEGVWDRVNFYWGDERYVPHNSTQSNYGRAHKTLLSRLHAGKEQVHPIPTDPDDPDEAARRYEEVLPERIDLLMAGLGEDGHTLSLFPGSSALQETERRVVAVEGPDEPRRRITLTPPVVRQAENVLVLVTGAEKAGALARVFRREGSVEETPGRLLREAVWFVDRDAAQKLEEMDEGPLAEDEGE